jgi:cellobiose phosphorylase
LPWLTGAATWGYYSASAYILGIQPDYEGLRIDPCIPADWDGFKAKRRFRGKWLNIEVKNPNGVEKGVAKMLVNGTEVDGNFIPVSDMKDQNEVLVIMG